MKTVIKLSVFITALTILLISACEPVEDPTDGDPRDAYVGEWNFVEKVNLKSTEDQYFVVTISKDASNSSQVIINNFGGLSSDGVIVKAVITSGQAVIPLLNMNGWIVEGSGDLVSANKKSMTWDYYITGGGDRIHYIATATKKGV